MWFHSYVDYKTEYNKENELKETDNTMVVIRGKRGGEVWRE